MEGLENLTCLNVSGLDFAMSSPTFLHSFPSIQNIVIQDANLDRVFLDPTHDILFHGLKHLKTLDLSRNHLDGLPHELLTSQDNLLHIILSANMFRRIPQALATLHSLQNIDLTANRISHLDNSEMKWLDELKQRNGRLQLVLAGNVLSCTCATAYFIDWLFWTGVQLDNNRNYTCVLDNGTFSDTITVHKSRDVLFKSCHSVRWLNIAVPSVMSLCVILMAAVLSYRYRYRLMYIRYKFHSYQIVDEIDYEFDAFIAYNDDDHDDNAWVASLLAVNLEKDDVSGTVASGGASECETTPLLHDLNDSGEISDPAPTSTSRKLRLFYSGIDIPAGPVLQHTGS
jgi:hypothetical protein